MNEYTNQELQLEEAARLRRKKRKRNNRIFAIFGLLGCFMLLIAVMWLLAALWDEWSSAGAKSTMADGEVVYSQEELDARLAEAAEAANVQAMAAEAAGRQKVLNTIQYNLENNISVVETLRTFYPEHMVLVSGGKYHFVPIREDLKQNMYDDACLNLLETGEIQYVEGGQVTSYKGIDVSKHQGTIDWQQVAADGVDFAFIRVALRGYGSTGKLVEDEKFDENIQGALSAGIKVGVYVYTQAITEEEVLEEANLVLQKIAPYKVECPVVYDVEMVSGANGRMNALTAEERTRFTKLFCETIKNAGYVPMIYHNMEMGALKINLEELEDYNKWFAFYNPYFYYPYEYDVWQYTDKGKVAGVQGEVDLNISFVPLWEE